MDRAWIEGELFPLCDRLRQDGAPDQVLTGRSLYCLFYEPSFLTRTSFERAMGLLGGQAYHTEAASQFFPVTTPNYIDNIVNLLSSLHMDVAVVRSSDAGVVERAAEADTVPVINGGSRDDHPTQALADIYTLSRELGRVDGLTMGIVGRLEHRNVSALLRALALFKGVKVIAVPFSGQVDPEVQALCEERGMAFATGESVDALTEADAIYLNGPRTLAHVQLLRSRNSFNLRIDEQFLSRLQAHCVVLDPMQRSGDFVVSTEDKRLSYYRQAENSLFVRMGVLSQMLG